MDEGRYQQLLDLVIKNNGNRSRIAKFLTAQGTPISTQAVSMRLRRYGLTERADNLSYMAFLRGSKKLVTPACKKLREEKIAEALSSSKGVSEAAVKLGISVHTVYRFIHQSDSL